MHTKVLNSYFRHLQLFHLLVALALLAPGLTQPATAQAATVTADVVAMDQVLVYNRLAAFNPAGMIFALARDVFPKGTMPAVQTLANSCAESQCIAGSVQLRDDKRPRPLTLRANEGDTIVITLTNLLSGGDITDAQNEAEGIQLPAGETEQPVTRNVGIHIQGMQWATGAADGGSNVGTNASSLVAPGDSHTYMYIAEKEGAYAITSGPNLGGEGGSGAIASGLFGVMNVEPAGSTWYRSQLTRAEMIMAADANQNGVLDPAEQTAGGQPIIKYDATYPHADPFIDANGNGLWDDGEEFTDLNANGVWDATDAHPYSGKPILAILDGTDTLHNELNAIIDGPMNNDLPPTEVYPNRGEPFREFTVVFHDEVKVVQAFPGWFDALPFTLGSVKDGFAINYGTGGIGSEIIANRLGVGPMKDCVDCKYEEFFLTSWAVGDPAMIVDVPASAGLEALAPGQAPSEGKTQISKATKAFYPDDPSNVWHGYLNDRTKIRNIHVGTEHHIFHLHAHQWLFASLDDESNYLDAQALGPGSSFSYEITYGGGGNRNKTPGDSIFHCHFYPHFAQGMWGLWRVHDVFEMGTELDEFGRPAPGSRALPDGEIAAGTPIPGVVPLPEKAMAPMPELDVAILDGEVVLTGTLSDETPTLLRNATPQQIVDSRKPGTAGNPGYPFFIPGVAGHRPPTPPMDLVFDGGLPRHVITGGTADATQTSTDFNKVLVTATGFQLPEDGTPVEKAAMAFHGPQSGGSGSAFHLSYKPNGDPGYFEVNGMDPIEGAPYADPCRGDNYDRGYSVYPIGNPRTYWASVIEIDADLNKVGWHFGQQRIIVLDGDVAATRDRTRAPEPFVMRANTGDCVDFNHTNLVPNVYQLDDFQVKTPTDVIGQHIHLVKFDVMSSDGAANGWNYEDGTLSPDEVVERVHAFKAPSDANGTNGGSWTGDEFRELGPRTTRQRWYIDTGWSGNVFTHDHYGPSTHQQAGLYGTLLIEPENSIWRDPVTGIALGTDEDGGPTSWRADIIVPAADSPTDDPFDPAFVTGDSYREFYLEFADFQLAYRGRGVQGDGKENAPNTPVNPSDRKEIGLPYVLESNCKNDQGLAGPNGCRPEAVSAADPGTFVVNYRNEPVAMRVRNPAHNLQAEGDKGDLAYAFKSGEWVMAGKGKTMTKTFIPFERADERLNTEPSMWPYNTPDYIQTANQGALPGDPFTPLLRAYPGDKVQLRIQVGAQEEGHNVSINGIKWLQQWKSGYSGFRNSQMAGISEQFIFNMPDRTLNTAEGMGGDDYLVKVGSSVDAIWNGSWSILRAYDNFQDGDSGDPGDVALQPLPDNPNPFAAEGFTCPEGQPREYDVVAVQAAAVLPDLDGRRPGDDGFVGGTLVYNSRKSNGGPLHDPTALLYVLEDDLEPIAVDEKCLRKEGNGKNAQSVVDVTLPTCTDVQFKTGRRVEPLILRAAAGECIEVRLHNKLPDIVPDSDGFNIMPMIVEKFNANNVVPSSHVGLHAQLVAYAMDEGDGMNVGINRVQTVGPGDSTVYTWYAGKVENGLATPVEFGAVNLMPADPIKHSNKGLIGALIIEPAGASWPGEGEIGTDNLLTRASVTVNHPGGSFRDFVVINQDDINLRCDNCGEGSDPDAVPIVAEEEEPEDSGGKGINYRTEPSWLRLGYAATGDSGVTRKVDYTDVWSNVTGEGKDPQTPVFTAQAGEEVRFRVLKPGGHNRNQVFSLQGHLWARHPWNFDSTVIERSNPYTFWHGEQMGHGPSNHFNAVPLNGAGLAGDYLYRDMTPVHVDNGQWGIFRVE